MDTLHCGVWMGGVPLYFGSPTGLLKEVGMGKQCFNCSKQAPDNPLQPGLLPNSLMHQLNYSIASMALTDTCPAVVY